MASFEWEIGCAGYDPGQYQYIEITPVSRNGSVVIVKYYFYAQSLGLDSFYYNERHNRGYIYVGGKMATFTYQMHGRGGGYREREGYITIDGVANGVTALEVAYENDRVWVNAPAAAHSPRSTGVFNYRTIGYVRIPDNVKHTISFNKGYSGNVSNLPRSFSVYHGSYYNIPNNIVVDNSNHYVFLKGYTNSYKGSVNLSSPSVKIGARLQANANATWYASWKKQTYTYRFFTDNSFKKEFSPSISTSYTYSNTPPKLPNLNSLSARNGYDNNNPSSPYYKKGYEFVHWLYNGGKAAPDPCNLDFNTNFYPEWKAISSKINFDYCYDGKVVSVDYTYNMQFNFARTYSSLTLDRPGYKLIGWSYTKPNRIYNPFEASRDKLYTFSVDDNKIVDYINNDFSNYEFQIKGITLYAVWEYYTTAYVFTDGSWHLALPLVFTDGEWKISLGYTCTDSKWKL